VSKLPALPTDSEILFAIECWIDDLVACRYEAAFERTAHDPYYGWTPTLIRAVIQGYGLPEPHREGPFEVTDRSLAVGRRAFEIERDGTPPAVAAFVYKLPLRAWSDLTASFRVEAREDHSELILEEIHVF